MNSTGFVKRWPIWTYLILTFVYSWVLWSVLLVTTTPGSMQEGISPSFFLLAALGGFGPSLAGIAATALVDGRPGLRDLFSRAGRWRVGIGWIAAALLTTPVVGLATFGVEAALRMPTATLDQMLATLPLSVIWPLFAALGEEFGWRGFCLPRLQKRYTALASSILLGLIWGMWHIPTIMLGYRQEGLWVVLAFVFVVHAVGITAQTTVMTWVHNNAKQSVLVMILFHFALTGAATFLFSMSSSAIEDLRHQVVYAVMYWVAAAIVIAIAGPKRLVRGSRGG